MPTGFDMWQPDDGETLAEVRKIVKFWTVKVFFGKAYEAEEHPQHLARYSKPFTACAAAEAAYRFYLMEEERNRKALAILDAQKPA